MLIGCALALGNLVFVMRKNEIDAAAMDVDGRLSQQAQRHRRAFEVPPGTTAAESKIPARLLNFSRGSLPTGLRRLPQHEIARVVFVVVVRIDAGACLQAVVIEPRKPAVLRKRRDLEIDGPFALVRVPVLLERPDELRHRVEVLLVGCTRALFDVFETKRARIFEERVDPLIRVLAQRHPRLLRSGDRAVVDVGEVEDVTDLVILEMAKRPAKHIDGDERPKVADMAAGVDGEAAGVHADEIVLGRGELFLGASQRVVQAHLN